MKNSLSPLALVQKAPLSFRELEVLEQVKQGFACKEISENLCIGLETVKTHRKKIISKLGLTGKMEFRRFILDLLTEEKSNFNKLLRTRTKIKKKQNKSPQNHP